MAFECVIAAGYDAGFAVVYIFEDLLIAKKKIIITMWQFTMI